VWEAEGVNGQVLQFRARAEAPELRLLVKQVESRYGISTRQVRYLQREGLPSEGYDYKGRRIFLASATDRWMDERQKRMGRA
jgi:hypothetical protein